MQMNCFGLHPIYLEYHEHTDTSLSLQELQLLRVKPKQLQQMSDTARANALGAVVSAQSGHVGIILDAAEMITCIFANHLRRGIDRFVLSSGHGSALLYSVLKLAGYKIGSIESFRKIGGLPGHPEHGIDGVDG